MPAPILNTFISAGAIIIGSLLGAYCTWIITMKNTKINLAEQKKILYENIKYEKMFQHKKLCEYANIIRLDICTALYQSIRTMNKYESGGEVYKILIPLNKRYSAVIAALSHSYELEELSYIYQLFGIIETINHITLQNKHEYAEEDYEKRLIEGYKSFVKKLYVSHYTEILAWDIEKVSYKELYDNSFIDKKYRNILIKLDELCNSNIQSIE